MSDNRKLNRATIGMHGVYRVAAELTGRGFVVSVTARSAPGVDLHASAPDFGKAFSVEVKTFQRNSGSVLLNKRATTLGTTSYIYAILTYSRTDVGMAAFSYHIIPSTRMVKLAREAWNGAAFVTMSDIAPYKDRWEHFS